MIRLAVVVMVAGCFSKPQLTPSDGAGGDGSGSDGDGGACIPSQPSPVGMTLDENVNHEWTAHMVNGASITFANPAAAYPMPIRIDVGNEQLVATGGLGCGQEQQVGLATFPYYYISGTVAPSAQSTLDRTVVGGSYIEMFAEWRYQHDRACSEGTPHGNGHTTWSFYPDGRVLRNDYIQPIDNISIMQGPQQNGCACIQNQSHVVSSFFAFEQVMVTDLTAFGDLEGATPYPANMAGGDVQNEIGACFPTPLGARVGIRWDDPASGPRHTRIRLINEIAFVNDLSPNATEPTLSSADSYGLRTHMFLDSTPGACVATNTKLLSHATLGPVTISDETVVDPSVAQHQNGYLDDVDDNNVLRERTSMVTLKAEVSRLEPGFALRIRFPGYQSITTDVPSTWQHEADDTFYIFFPDELADGEELHITPECRN